MAHDLYRTILLDHYRHPRHSQPIQHPTHTSDTSNRSCGDRVQIQLTVVSGVVTEVGIVTEGCALAVAGGSALAEAIAGQSVSAVQAIDAAKILALLGGIQPSPSRTQCATLALVALQKALHSRS